MREPISDFREMLTAELVSVMGGIAVGTLLAFAVGKLALVPGLFILMPGFLAMRGSIAASLAARISTALHLRKKGASKERSQFGKQNIHASFLMALVVSLVLGLVAYVVTRLLFGIDVPEILFIALIAAFISNVLMIPIAFASTVWLFNHGYDPDDIMGPYITTVGDVVSMVSLLVAVWIV